MKKVSRLRLRHVRSSDGQRKNVDFEHQSSDVVCLIPLFVFAFDQRLRNSFYYFYTIRVNGYKSFECLNIFYYLLSLLYFIRFLSAALPTGARLIMCVSVCLFLSLYVCVWIIISCDQNISKSTYFFTKPQHKVSLG